MPAHTLHAVACPTEQLFVQAFGSSPHFDEEFEHFGDEEVRFNDEISEYREELDEVCNALDC